MLLDGMATPKESWIVFTLTMTSNVKSKGLYGWIIWMDGCQQEAAATRQALSSVALLTHKVL
jgi:hypothetical protein